MRVLILNTNYADFVRCLHAQYPGLEKRPSYGEQMWA